MSHVVRLGQRGLTLAVACIVLASPALLPAQATHPLAQRLANYSVAVEENKHLLSIERIPLTAYQEKAAALAAEARDINTQLRAFPRDVQAQIRQQATSLFNVRIVPLREQWKQLLAEKVKADQARDAQRRVELTADADAAGKLQAARALIRERLQRNEISQAEAARADQAAEQQVLALQRKYDSYGTTSRINWGVAFSQAVATAASTTVADARLRERLEDTQSEVGRDAHRATELTLAMQRNSVFLAQQALTALEARALNDAAQKELIAIQAKYGPTVPSTADFNDRLARLVRTGTAAQRQDWEREALAARDAAAAKLAAGRQAAAAAAQQAAAQHPAAQPMPSAPAPRASTSATQRPAAQRPPALAAPPPAGADRTGSLGSNVVVAADLPAAARGRWRRRILRVPRQAPRVPCQVLRCERAICAGTHGSFDGACHSGLIAAASARTSSSRDGQGTAAGRTAAEVPGALRRGHGRRDAGVDGAVGDGAGAAGRARERAEAVEVAADAGGSAGDCQNRQYAIGSHPRCSAAAALHTVQEARAGPEAGADRRRLADGAGRAATHRRRRYRRGAPPYLIVVGVLFFVERYLRLKVPLSALKKHVKDFNDIKLAYIYTDQLPHLTPEGHAQLHAIRIRAAEKKATADDITVPTGGNITVAHGGFLIGVGDLGTYTSIRADG